MDDRGIHPILEDQGTKAQLNIGGARKARGSVLEEKIQNLLAKARDRNKTFFHCSLIQNRMQKNILFKYLWKGMGGIQGINRDKLKQLLHRNYVGSKTREKY